MQNENRWPQNLYVNTYGNIIQNHQKGRNNPNVYQLINGFLKIIYPNNGISLGNKNNDIS
jgi:hypothetical protein